MERLEWLIRKADVVQPDYGSWTAITVGMSRAEVDGILGPPLGRERVGKEFPPEGWECYGFLKLPVVRRELTYAFLLYYDERDVVRFKEDPFPGGQLSVDGFPSVPIIISPQDRACFCHYPRILDVRWSPASGVYPITYEVVVECAFWNERGLQTGGVKHGRVLNATFTSLEFVGAQRGRVRVRAVNAVGEGDWSQWSGFHFVL